MKITNENRIIRVFPRRTSWTPDDGHVAVNRGPGLFDDYDIAEISVTFSWDVDLAFRLGNQWEKHCKVVYGGPAFGSRGEDFVPGRYLKRGAVITSRGCPNRCWFCDVPKREGGKVRELPITDGWNIFDDNLLRCSERHVRAVFQMLDRQPQRVVLSGGLEAAALQDWHIDLLANLKPKRVYFAYDTPDDYEPLYCAGKKLIEARLSHALNAYVLIGYRGDTLTKAEERCRQCLNAGFMPMAMLYAGKEGRCTDKHWRKFQKEWARPAIVRSKIRK